MYKTTSPLGCSAFCLRDNGGIWVARNLDVPFTHGHILTNPRHIFKQSIVDSDPRPAKWTSKWGSITVNLLGVDLPMGGMNECGLVIEHLWMPGTVYKNHTKTEKLLEFEWIQHMLDMCSCVESVLSLSEKIEILHDRVEMHFLLADKNNCALLEFRDGEKIFYMNSSFSPPVVTNSWYDEANNYASSVLHPDKSHASTRISTDSLERFVRLVHATKNICGNASFNTIDTAMKILDSVEDSTLLSAVFHPFSGSIHFKTCDTSIHRTLQTRDFDFSAHSRLMFDIHETTDQLRVFDPQEIIKSMERTLHLGGEFLRLKSYQEPLISRQTNTRSIFD